MNYPENWRDIVPYLVYQVVNDKLFLKPNHDSQFFTVSRADSAKSCFGCWARSPSLEDWGESAAMHLFFCLFLLFPSAPPPWCVPDLLVQMVLIILFLIFTPFLFFQVLYFNIIYTHCFFLVGFKNLICNF